MSYDDVVSLMAQPGFHLPRGSIPAAEAALPGTLMQFTEEVDRRLRTAAERPLVRPVPAVDRVSFHKYEGRKQSNEAMVVDHATGLTWLVWNARDWRSFCRARIDQLLNFESATDCIKLLNESRVAGRRDWRLPTLEELASLLSIDAVVQRDGAKFHIDPLLGPADSIAWSADPFSGASGMQWGVCFAPDDRLMDCGTPKAWPQTNRGRLFAVRATQ